MAVHGACSTILGLYRHHRHRSTLSSPPQMYQNFTNLLFYFSRSRWLSSSAEPAEPPELSGKNAYELLGVSESSSFAEIKASFRKLAKETHPDLAQSPNEFSTSHRFVQILAAYEILSDTEKRTQYDRYLLSQKLLVQRQARQGSAMYTYESYGTAANQMEVVEWLKWYRYAINDILAEKRVASGTGYFDALERDFYSAIHAAYYGPEIESVDLLPDCFEADERSVYGTPEVLHLVSGRDLFGMVCVSTKFPELSHAHTGQLPPVASESLETCHSVRSSSTPSFKDAVAGIPQTEIITSDFHASDAYKNLELHLSGKIVAVANRVPPKSCTTGISDEDSQDHVHVYLNANEDQMYPGVGFANGSVEEDISGSRILLGTIIGLGTSGEEGSCFVHNNAGVKTHLIMKHRTLLVKHLHWYQLGDKASVCECRCTRARLPPSKYWLFEPRSGLHDTGGWYVETYGRDKKGRTVSSQRYWDGIDTTEPFERRLHPAMYLLALAYRTLDIEDTKRNKHTVRDVVEEKSFKLFNWCKKLM